MTHPRMNWPRFQVLPRRGARCLPGAREGATAVEFALLAPVMFTLILGGMEFGRMMWTLAGLNFSVQEGARCWAVGVCASSGAAASFAAAAAPQLGFPTSTFTATVQTCGCQIKASDNFRFVAKGYFPVNPTLTATACFPGTLCPGA